jgi:hypothetical protein
MPEIPHAVNMHTGLLPFIHLLTVKSRLSARRKPRSHPAASAMMHNHEAGGNVLSIHEDE